MYCILVDIPGFRQVARTNRLASVEIMQKLQKYALDSGAGFNEISPGRWLVPFPNLRISDSRFIIEAFGSFQAVFNNYKDELMGASVLLELIEDPVLSESELFHLLLQIHESFGAWLGPLAAAQLASLVRLERQGQVWKVLEHFVRSEKDNAAPIEIVEKLLPSKDLLRKIERINTSGRGSLYIETERIFDSGTLVERTLSRVLTKRNERFFLWVRGVDRTESPALALVRYLSASVLEFAEREGQKLKDWPESLQFLELGLSHSWGSRKGRDHYRGMFYDLINVQKAWRLLLTAFKRACNLEDIPLVLHIEHPEELPEMSRKILIDSIVELQKDDDCQFVFIITQADDSFRSIKIEGVREFFHVPNYLPSSLDLVEKVSGLSSLRGQLDANTVAMLQYLFGSKDEQSIIELAPELGSLSIHAEVFKHIEPLELETYYIILLTTGLFPLERIHDFLISINVERIRIPKIFERLYLYGLTRMEELPFPVYPHEPEDIEGFLGDRALELRTSLDLFLESLIKQGETHANPDLFDLAVNLVENERFLKFTFVFAERLLDTDNVLMAEHVINHLGDRAARIVEPKLKSQYVDTISYLNCRLVLKNVIDSKEVIGYSYLEQLSIGDGPMRGYMYLQRARFYLYQGEIDQAQTSVKRSIMAFQDLDDQKGLSASQLVFGITLLCKNKLFEAHDYFTLARGTASAGSCLYEETRATYWGIVVLYLHGFLSRAHDAILDPRGISDVANRYGMIDLKVALKLLLARISFDLGQYANSEGHFLEAQGLAQTLGLDAVGRSISAWLYRIKLITGELNPERNQYMSHANPFEYALFTAEYYLWAKKPDLAVGVLDGISTVERLAQNAEALFSNTFFGQFEDVLGYGGGIPAQLSNLIETTRAYALALSGKPETAATFLATKTRSKTIGPHDPFSHIYYFQYSEVLRLLGKNKYDDADTILGKSVKFFQERASRIDDPGQKQSFLKENVQSRKLLEIAKQYNLA